MSQNPQKDEAIEKLSDLSSAQPFAQVQVNTSAADPFKVSALGQAGNVQSDSDGLTYSMHLLAAHLLMIENVYDVSLDELGENAVELAERYKDGREDPELDFHFKKDWRVNDGD